MVLSEQDFFIARRCWYQSWQLVSLMPISHFDFQKHFNAEEYFKVKLCNICDKANVPHHIMDDIINL